jgi:hypothetical protein
MSGVHQIRGGKLNNSNFGERMTGVGPRWQVVSDLFEMHCKRLGIQTTRTGMDAREVDSFERPERQTQQLKLF